MKKVVFCTPVLVKPTDHYLESLEKSIPLIEKAGWEHYAAFETGSTYISWARASCLYKAMEKNPDCVVFIDYDLSWDAGDLLRLLETPGEVVAGTYRFKKEPEEYMGKIIVEGDGKPSVRDDGCIKAGFVPAGFLKVTSYALEKFATSYPQLIYGSWHRPHLDLFNHGSHEGLWWGEDYAFCRNWRKLGEDIWLIPDLSLNHHAKDKEYKGNFSE